ncbi:MAG: FtsH protease activity modulator HflK [Phycisphaerae bacterium]|nr:FtsH protease activity modulator HflK [Phycisphaerae bacterium]
MNYQRNRDYIDVGKNFKDDLLRYRRSIIIGGGVLLFVLSLFSTFYSVEADSEAVLLRFGKYARTTAPGLHGKLPWPVERVYQVQVQKVQSLEFGFSTQVAGQKTRYAPQSSRHEQVANMLTGDLNLAHVEWIVQYRIKDAFNYLFKIGGNQETAINIDDTIRAVSEAVMRELVGDASVDEVITIGRDKIASDAKVKVQKMLDSYGTGIEIITVKLQSATPPESVKDAFDEVNRAPQNKERVINEARGERNSKIPAARGLRDRTITEAEGYRERVTRIIAGQVNAFLSQLKEYDKAPEVTRTRLYIETMEQIYSQTGDKIIIDKSVQGVLPFLDIGTNHSPGQSTTSSTATKGRAK